MHPSRLKAAASLVTVGRIPTELLTIGALPVRGGHAVTIVFPGNPGSPHFYEEFAEALFSAAAASLACVVVVGHAAHSLACVTEERTRDGACVRYDLDAQIAHKRAYVDSLLASCPPDTRLVLVGHSVGAHMVLEVAKTLAAPPAHCVLLMPTLAHISRSPSGLRLSPFFRHGRALLAAVATLARCMPRSCQRALARSQLPASADEGVVQAALSLVHPDVGVNALFLAHHEMEEIRELSVPPLVPLERRITAYFAADDHWNSSPGGDAAALSSALPDARVLVCREGHRHAFVLDPAAARRVAALTWGWVREAVR